MKNACPVCGKGKARRLCARHGGVEICSKCCAETRDPDCGDCIYYATTTEYETQRDMPKPGNKHFMIELNPEIDRAVDDALVLLEAGRREKAAAALHALHRDHPANHMVLYGLGTLEAIGGDPERAIHWLEKATDAYPYFTEAHYNKAVTFKKRMDIPNAARAFQKVVEVGDSKVFSAEISEAKSFLANMEETIRKYHGISLKTFLDAAEDFDRGFTLMEEGEWSAAINSFRKSLQKNPSNPSTHGNAGLCLARLGHKAEALAALDQALEIDSSYMPARNNRKLVAKMQEGQPLFLDQFKSAEPR